MRFAVVVFPGSNCDRDCHHVLTNVMGIDAEYVWHRDSDLSGFDGVVLPGGFSYGDYLRAGAVSKISPIMQAVRGFADAGRPVIGICNGFQILLECDLLPGAMLRNRSLRFMCKDVNLRVATSRTPFTAGLSPGDILRLPIANAEGNFTVSEAGLAQIRDNDQVVFEYCDDEGGVSPESNPNGSLGNIAGICNVAGNVVGMMPHPERAAEAALGNVDGKTIFASVIETLAGQEAR